MDRASNNSVSAHHSGDAPSPLGFAEEQALIAEALDAVRAGYFIPADEVEAWLDDFVSDPPLR